MRNTILTGRQHMTTVRTATTDTCTIWPRVQLQVMVMVRLQVVVIVMVRVRAWVGRYGSFISHFYMEFQ